MPPLEFTISAVWVGGQAQMGDDPPQPRRIQPPGRLHQHRFGLGGDRVGEVLGAMGQHPGMGHAEFPADQGLAGRGERTTEHGPGRPHKASRSASTQAQPGAQPSGGRANLLPLVSPCNAAGIDGRELLEPVAFQAVHHPPPGQHLLGQHRISQPV